MRKRIFSILLTIAVCLSMMPAGVWANEGNIPEKGTDNLFKINTVEEFKTFQNKVNRGGTADVNGHTHNTNTAWKAANSLPNSAGSYYLTQSVSGGWTVPEGEVNLCLNGQTIDGSIKVGSGATLTLTDCTGKGKLQGSGSGSGSGVSINGGTFELYGGTITGGLLIQNWGKLVGGLKEGTIITSNGTYSVSVERSTDTYDNVLGLLGDGLAFAKYDENAENKAGAIVDGSVKQLTEDVIVVAHTTHTVGKDNKCACGFSCTHTSTEGASTIGEDGKCTICGTQFAAAIGEIYYTDVKSAMDTAADGQTVKLLANGMLPDGIYASKTLTLDLNGHSLSGYSLNVGGLTPTSQVRTGNLTVIDSSGGNGAVGVTVRNGGTLVFDPKNDSTTLLQLEVWGGTVELYGGKISRNGLRLNNSITLGNLLPQKAGLAYYCGDTQLTLEEAASKTCDLVVKSCSHGGKNGFDKNATTCPYCNAPAVAETALNNGDGNRPQRRFADLQTALDADRDGGAELTLLSDVTGNYTIDGTRGLDLNGHSIKGTVTVKGIKGDYITTTLSNTTNTTTASIDKVVAYDGAELAGSKYPAVIGTLTLAEGATWKNILNDTALGYKVLNADGTHKWYAQDGVNGSQLNNVIINRLPITSKTLNLKVNGKNLTGRSLKVERGTTVQLCASCNAKGADVYIYTGKIDGNNVPTYSQKKAEYKKIGTSWYYVVDLTANTIGTYDIYFTATKDGYSVTSSHKKLTVTKATIPASAITAPAANALTYNGNEQALITAGSVTDYGTMQYSLTKNGTYSQDIPTGTDAGAYTVWYRVIGDANHYDTAPASVAVSIGQKPLTIIGVTAASKPYDGTTNAGITSVTFDGVTLNRGTDYTVTASFNDAGVGNGKNVTATVTLTEQTAKNYALEQSSFPTTGNIIKAAAPTNIPTGTLNVINGTQQTYTYDFSKLLPEPSEGEYGTISYGNQADISLVSQSGYYYDESIVEFKNGVLTLAQFYAKDGKMTGKIGTVKVTVTTTNYKDFQLTLFLNAVNRITPVPDGTITASEITYGDALSKSEISGKMKDPDTGDAVDGTFAWTNGTINPNAGDYEAEWTFTPAAGYEKYATATGTVTIKVNKATPTFTAPTAQENLTYTGQEQALITAGSVTDYGTMQYSLTENGIYSQDIPTGTDAGAYTVWYRVIGDANHNDTAPASVAVRIGKKPLTITGVTAASKPYDGTTNADISSVTFDNVTLNRGTDYTVTANFDDASVDSGKNITATVTLMEQAAKNYALEQSSFPTTGSIIKAAAPDFTKETALTIVNGHEKTYTVTLPALPTLETPKEYGALTYEIGEIKLNDGYYTSGAKVENGKLTLPIQKNDVKTTGSVGTVTVVIKSTNYADITLTVNVNATNKLVPTVTAPTANALTYNGAEQALVTAGKTTGGTMLYRLGDSEWSKQIPTAKNAGEYTVWYKVQGDAEYADVAEQNVTVVVAKKAVTVTALGKSAYTGSTAPDLSSPKADKDYKVEGLVGADTLSGTVTLTYEQTPDMSKTGETAINITGTLSNDNYEITYVPGTLTVSNQPSGGGGGIVIPVQKPEITTGDGGKTDLSDDGTTIKITPDEGKEVDKVLVNGKDIGAVTEVKDLKPGDKVEVIFKDKIKEPTKEELDSKVKEALNDMTLKARSAKTSKKNIRINVIASITDKLPDGYTVKYKYYRSTKKTSGYRLMTAKSKNYYINTKGTKGTRYYYKARVAVYDNDGKLIAQTELKQCKYAARVWTKLSKSK